MARILLKSSNLSMSERQLNSGGMHTFKIVDLLNLPSGNLSALYPKRKHHQMN